MNAAVPTRVQQHEDAAHQKRNWVRLTFDCNDRCIFCLDSNTHDGTNRCRDEVKAQILDGRRKGAERLILSGGEPTIHPNFVDFVRLGKLAGYERVQTVTNGRLFAYGEFLQRSLDAGLQEITFSIHGPNARVHDALVGVKGAFEEEVTGLKAALADGRAIVNIDICVNRANVRHLAPMLEHFYDIGVREFDLLQVIPFGRAYSEAKETLFYDLDDAREHWAQALAFSQRPDVHVWLNRFPVEHLEGYEHLIQDPYKLTDEVRGRKEEFGRWISHGEPLDCRDPARCKYCYVERLCDHVEATLETAQVGQYELVRVEPNFEASQPAVYGGDPASARKRLPMLGAKPRVQRSIADQLNASGAKRLWICATNVAQAREVAERLKQNFATVPGAPLPGLELELSDDAGLADELDAHGHLAGLRLSRVCTLCPDTAQRWLALRMGTNALADLEVELILSTSGAQWLRSLEQSPGGLQVRVPSFDRSSAAAALDVDLGELFADLAGLELPVTGVPACVLGRAPLAQRETLDLSIHNGPGQLDIFRVVRRYIAEQYLVKSSRCRGCAADEQCAGLHVNHVRAQGFALMRPIA